MDGFEKFLRPDEVEFHSEEIGGGPIWIYGRFPGQIFNFRFRRQNRSRSELHFYTRVSSTKMVIVGEPRGL